MKRLFTSCYNRSKWFGPDAAQVIVSRGVPEWWRPQQSIRLAALAPDNATWAASKTKRRDWREVYREQLDRLHYSGMLKKLIDQVPEGSIMLCHEALQSGCHRGVLADYLNEHGLAAVSEWQIPAPPPPAPKPASPQLEWAF
jgi:hypothetical protein